MITVDCPKCVSGTAEDSRGSLVPCGFCDGHGFHTLMPGCDCTECEGWFVTVGDDVVAVECNEFVAIARAGGIAQTRPDTVTVLDRFAQHKPWVFVTGDVVEVR